ncbi:multiple sugar transport system permease protein/raffinose/stachyose/melibiose transport system permease protein [Actinocrispum wychmicini]|uniref:Multiple sugar transport system permease protein/raffinose/stachyose/melibiose transport system permease protein n=2 Tax=Actinocrispum wychmicini TaxID=1213861 RepID=A0A4R2JIU4_9PSEU|nr:multiple sugar transport system permease protein/raffinose/stachyose/melibiose transport system permease protein [Actinocrispum wychmicini]
MVTLDESVASTSTPVRARRPVRFNPAYLFVAPALVLAVVFILWPIVQSGWMSLHDWTIGADSHAWLGFGNFVELWHDDRFWNALRVTLVYTVFVVAGQILVGLALAQWLRRTTWYTMLLRSAFFFPTIASLAVTGIVWKFLLDPQIGLVNGWLGNLGLEGTAWLQDTALALPALIAVGIWKNFGFSMIVLLAAVQGVRADLVEAAKLDGANAVQRFRHVTLPAVRPALLFTTVIGTINALQLFDLNYVMTGGGPVFHTESIVMYLYQRGFVDFRLGYASAIAWVLFLLILVVSVVQLRTLRYRDDD